MVPPYLQHETSRRRSSTPGFSLGRQKSWNVCPVFHLFSGLRDWLLSCLSWKADRSWCIPGAREPLRRTENWKTCFCSRGPMVGQTEDDTAQQPVPRYGMKGVGERIVEYVSNTSESYPQGNWLLFHLTWSTGRSGHTLKAHWQERAPGWRPLKTKESWVACSSSREPEVL